MTFFYKNSLWSAEVKKRITYDVKHKGNYKFHPITGWTARVK
jgi:hypothetical protein